MKLIPLYQGQLQAPSIVLGCMRIAELPISEVSQLIQTSLELGIDFFDHADIYGAGKCEEVFAQAIQMSGIKREKIIIQSKCGIQLNANPRYFDFSKAHILKSVEGSLRRLKTEYLDILLLHRPDTLMEPEEVAEAFHELHQSGKVRYFGVSNQNPMQIELLKKYVQQPLLINQLQLSMTNSWMMDTGFHVNMNHPDAVVRDGSILEYCRLHEITIQAWSPFLYGHFEGVFLGNDKFPEMNAKIEEMAEKYQVPPIAIPVAWILRHPARMQTIVGTTQQTRLREIALATNIEISRPDWYALYKSAGHTMP